MSERVKFVGRLLAGEKMTDLCREFGISRKTGHKMLKRYKTVGLAGLADVSRRPKSSPNRTPQEKVDRLVEMREQYPSWGPRKIRNRLKTIEPGIMWPAVSTVGEILKREGLVTPRQRRRRAKATPTALSEPTKPNELWCVDFKGDFRLGNRQKCLPLTTTDQCSRYILCSEALESTKSGPVRITMEAVFTEYGLPDAMRSDNGPPFASTGLLGLSSFSVWLMRHGIRLERISPGHPEQNGRHERMHLTMKQEATRPPGANLLQQQEKLDTFREVFNNERPHEALGDATPASVFSPSPRRFEPDLPALTYPLHDLARRVRGSGEIKFLNARSSVYLSQALAGENVGLRETAVGTWLVHFMDLELGYIDEATGTFYPPDLRDTAGSTLQG